MSSLPRVFVGSSSPGLVYAPAIADRIGDFAVPILWTNREVFGPTGANLASLLDQMPRVDAAILVASADDQLSRGRFDSRTESVPRDNVVFEIGLFIGALGRARTVFLRPQGSDLTLPSDLAGEGWINYPADLGEGLAQTIDRLRQWLTGAAFRGHTCPILRWPNEQVVGSPLLCSSHGEARHSLLLMGNTLAQFSAADQQELADWLGAESHRRMGLLFLNPNGPHAEGRERPLLRQGTREVGLAAYVQALTEAMHERCVPLVYDGPYRYSMRGIDLAPHTRSAHSEAHVTHSTHLAGIRRGYSLSLPYQRGAEAFEYFASDALSLWRSAWANPPGHGATLAVCRPRPEGKDQKTREKAWADNARMVLSRAATRLLQQTGRPLDETSRGVNFHLNPAPQWHYTLCSLKRTGPRWGGPLSQSAPAGSEEQLPAGFDEFVHEVCASLNRVLADHSVTTITPRVTQLKLTAQGHLIAYSPSIDPAFAEAMAEFYTIRQGLAQARKFDPTCLLKHLDFWPHVSVGMVFQNDQALPEPLLGVEREVELDEVLTWPSGVFHVVHYAYRTFRRNVGIAAVPIGGPVPTAAMLTRSLRMG